MDKDDDLAHKVDALLGKHGVTPHSLGRRRADATMLPGAEDRNIPVLTDVIEAPAWAPPLSPSVMQRLSDDEIDLLSHDIFTRVIDRIDGSLGSKIEKRLSEQLQSQIKLVVLNVLTDLRQDIANEIGDAVNAALADQLRDIPPR
jgi:hypothetical protein